MTHELVDRRRAITLGATKQIKQGDVFFSRRKDETVVVVEVLDDRYARIVSESDLSKERLWRLTYLASAACELQPHASPNKKVVKDWQKLSK